MSAIRLQVWAWEPTSTAWNHWTLSGGQSEGYFLALSPYIGLMLWSPPWGAAGAGDGLGGGGAGGSLGVGVELRLTDHGLIDSTAEAHVDFSAFLSAPDPEAIILCHADEACEEDQLLTEWRLAWLAAALLQALDTAELCGANLGREGTKHGRKRSVWVGVAIRRVRAGS